MKHKGQAVWLQQRGQHQTVLFLLISLSTEVVLWPTMTFIRAGLDPDGVELCRPHKCCRCDAFSLLLWNSVLAFEGKMSLIWRHCVVLLLSWNITRTENRPQSVSRPNSLGWRTCCFSLKLRKETGFLLESPRECVWENLCGPLESPQRDRVQNECTALTMGERYRSLWSEMPWKKCTLFTAPHGFCSSGPVTHLQGLRLTDLLWLPRMPTPVSDLTFCCHKENDGSKLLCFSVTLVGYYIKLYYITLHYIILHYIVLHCYDDSWMSLNWQFLSHAGPSFHKCDMLIEYLGFIYLLCSFLVYFFNKCAHFFSSDIFNFVCVQWQYRLPLLKRDTSLKCHFSFCTVCPLRCHVVQSVVSTETEVSSRGQQTQLVAAAARRGTSGGNRTCHWSVKTVALFEGIHRCLGLIQGDPD